MGHETDHTSPSSAEIRNEYNYTSILMVLCSIKHHRKVRFQVLMVANTKFVVFWVVAPYSLVDDYIVYDSAV
jgi:hypothetical protein